MDAEKRLEYLRMGYIPFVERVLASPIEDARIGTFSLADILEWFLTSETFVTGDRYPRETMLLDKEVGYLAIMHGRKIYPVLRVRWDGEETTEGKESE